MQVSCDAGRSRCTDAVIGLGFDLSPTRGRRSVEAATFKTSAKIDYLSHRSPCSPAAVLNLHSSILYVKRLAAWGRTFPK